MFLNSILMISKKKADEIANKYGVESKSLTEIFKISDLDGIMCNTAKNHYDLAKKL